MRINWLSNAPWAATGYGNQTKVFVPRLKALGHDLAISAFYGLEGGMLNWNGITVFPKGFTPYGNDIGGAHALVFGADVTISLIDVWVCDAKMLTAHGVPWIPWFPIDSDPVSPAIVATASPAYKRLVFSRHACKMLDVAGMTYDYIPHGIETNVLRPMPRDEARAAMSKVKIDIPPDAFMVGMVAANKGNPSRKAFDNQIAGFAEFRRKHRDSVLYLHTLKCEHGENQGVNLTELCRYYGLEPGKDVFFPDQYQTVIGWNDEYMRAIYSAMDVKLMATMGEGFGIPIVEAQACGTPVIVGDWTANGELCFSGWKIPKSDAVPIWTGLGTNQYHVRPEAIRDTLEMAYNKRGNQRMRERAREGALQYDADKVTAEYWAPYLEKLSDELGKTKSAPLTGHKHQWSKIGLFNPSGTISTPCVLCNDELVNGSKIITDGFKPDFGDIKLKFVPDSDGVTKIVAREIMRDYKLDNLDLKAGDTIIDIGAHKGIVSCYLAKKYPQATIYAFEPVAENFTALCENLKLNGIENVKPRRYAITGDGRDVQVTADPAENSGGSNIYGTGDAVNSVMLSDVMGQQFGLGNKRIALLKIDCEGAEFEILRADSELLDRVDHIRGEFHRSAGDVGELLKLCKQHCSDVVVSLQG